MHTFLAVLKDLWDFVLVQLSLADEKKTMTPPDFLLSEVKPAVQIALPDIGEKTTKYLSEPDSGNSMYIVKPEACIFYRPVFTYDGVIDRLVYATKLSVLGFEGRFARVVIGDRTGFVLKDELTDDKSDIFPEFLSEEMYSSNHPDTKKVRTLIKDDFFAAPLYLPLQAAEFVMYKLMADGRQISWPSERPRTAGRWQTILKGKAGIQIGIQPKTGSIIEFTKPDGTGFVGYTKAVHVDDTIVIQGVGRLIEGEYREELVTKEVWHEWRPVWISVT